jgi:hypothetical protein
VVKIPARQNVHEFWKLPLVPDYIKKCGKWDNKGIREELCPYKKLFCIRGNERRWE